jgi:hypothetical protein
MWENNLLFLVCIYCVPSLLTLLVSLLSRSVHSVTRLTTRAMGWPSCRFLLFNVELFLVSSRSVVLKFFGPSALFGIEKRQGA